MLVYLKNKIETLVFEAKNIRSLEMKCKRRAVKTAFFAKEPNKVNKNDMKRLANQGYSIQQIQRICQRAEAAMNKRRPAEDYALTIEKCNNEFWGLRNHRTIDLRRESRSTNLAYGFLKGHPYEKIEFMSFTPPDWNRIEQLINKYGEEDERILQQRFAEWKEAAHKNVPEHWINSYQYKGLQNAKPKSVRQFTDWSSRWVEKHKEARLAYIEKLKQRRIHDE